MFAGNNCHIATLDWLAVVYGHEAKDLSIRFNFTRIYRLNDSFLKSPTLHLQ